MYSLLFLMAHDIKSNVIKKELANATFIATEIIRIESVNQIKRYGVPYDKNNLLNSQFNSSNFKTSFLYLKFKEDILMDLTNNVI